MSERVLLGMMGVSIFMVGTGIGGLIEKGLNPRTDAEQTCSKQAVNEINENIHKLNEATKALKDVHAIIREEREEIWRRWIAGCTSALTESGEDNALEKCRTRARTYSSLEVHP